MRKITQKQMKLMELIQKYINNKGYPPSYRELAEMMGIVSPSTIKSYLDSLKKKGYVDWQEGMSRTLYVLKKINFSK